MVREVNEDSMVTFDSPNGRVIAVCDGMGGQAAGDVASRLACDVIQDILVNNTFSTPTEAITRAVVAANQGILHRAASSPELEGMGATCVIVIVKDGLAYYGWVGDSRIYYFSNGVLRQISRDQSYVQQLVDAGQITAAEAEHHPQKNEITNALGLATMTPPELCTAPLTPEPGSMLLLCSDGLSGMISGEHIQQVLNGAGTLQQKADALVDAANAAGGYDNVTVQIVEFTPAAAAPAPGAPARVAAAGAVKNSNRMMMYIAIVLVAILIVLGVGYFVGMKKEKPVEAVSKEAVDTRDDDRPRNDSKVAPQQQTTTVKIVEEKEAPKSQGKSAKKQDKSKKKDDNFIEKNKNKNKDKKDKDTESIKDAVNKEKPKGIEGFQQQQTGKSLLDEKKE